ncbi:hypothetical protein GCM10022402_32240 [Salinactinospora qingdaonensis]|uniref:Uncharacterized protein n=1 Tax=Salinactinospora qingdaonensis TaxID=702744 RepID=A0ABP7G2T8_9ACTN
MEPLGGTGLERIRWNSGTLVAGPSAPSSAPWCIGSYLQLRRIVPKMVRLTCFLDWQAPLVPDR